MAQHKVLIPLIVTATVISLGWIFLVSNYNKHTDKRVLASQVQVSPQPTPPATQASSSAAATSSPSPQPVVFTGYCPNVPILMYHHIQPAAQAKTKGQTALSVDNGTFDSQMAYLRSRGYNTITMDQLAQALINHSNVPGRSIVVTVDDGYQDAYTYAFPIAQKHSIKLNLFIATGLLNNPDYMNWDQLKQMVSSGSAIAYDHSWSHASLGSASLDKIKYEVTTAKKQLSDNLGSFNPIFAYPYGSMSNNVIKVLKDNNFIAAASTLPGTTQCDSTLMSLHRTRIGGSALSAYGL